MIVNAVKKGIIPSKYLFSRELKLDQEAQYYLKRIKNAEVGLKYAG